MKLLSGGSHGFLWEVLPYLLQLPIRNVYPLPGLCGQVIPTTHPGIKLRAPDYLALMQLFSWRGPYLCQKGLNLK